RAMASALLPIRSAPSSATRPLSGTRRPEIMFTIVLLPAPLGPIRAVILPGETVNPTSATAFRPRNDLDRSFTSSVAGAMRGPDGSHTGAPPPAAGAA